MKNLKEKYEKIIDEYVRLFEKKHDMHLEHWVSDDKTGVACFGDILYYSVSDIIFDINNDLPAGLAIDWVYDTVEYHSNVEHPNYINLFSYSKGLRYSDL
jgi:hypothetical protein